MSAKFSTFLHVGGEPYRYTFLLVRWNDYADAVRDEINRQAEAFGADLGPEGLFVQPYTQRMYETAEEVLRKPGRMMCGSAWRRMRTQFSWCSTTRSQHSIPANTRVRDRVALRVPQ